MSGNIRLLNWFYFFSEFRLYGPFAIIYFSEISGSFVSGMAVFSVTTVVSSLFEIPSGILSDRLGRRRTIVAGAFFSLVAVLCYALASAYWLLLLGAAIEGLARSLFSGNNSAFLYDCLREENKQEKYHHYFGKLNSTLQIALAAAALLGGILGYWSLALVMWLSVPPQFFALLVSLRFREPVINRTDEHKGSVEHLLGALKYVKNNPRLLWVIAAQSIASGFGEAGFQFKSAFYNSLWPLWAIGVLVAVANALAAIGFRFAAGIIDRFRHLRVLMFCSIVGQLTNLVGVWLANLFSPVIMTLTSSLYGVRSTALNHLLQQDFNSEQRATLGSIASFCVSLVYASAALMIGWIADGYGTQMALFTTLGCQALVLPIYFKLFAVQQGQLKQNNE